jgi:hypothetical protein
MSMTVSKRYPVNELPAADPCCPDHCGRTLLDTRDVAGLPDCLCNVCHTQLIYNQPELGWTRARLARAVGDRDQEVRELRAREVAQQRERAINGKTMPDTFDPTLQRRFYDEELAKLKDLPAEEIPSTEAPEGTFTRLDDGTWVRE